MPHRERYLFICTNRREEGNPKGSCAQKGSEELVKALKEGFKRRGAADRIDAALTAVLAERKTITRDLGGSAGTRAFTDAIVQKLSGN